MEKEKAVGLAEVLGFNAVRLEGDGEAAKSGRQTHSR